jgi:hypothetical protein
MIDGEAAELDGLTAVAERLAGETVKAIRPTGRGANSRIFRVDLRSHALALKSYPRRPGDRRDRLETEWAALRFLRSNDVTSVPAPIARDKRCRLMMMEWIEGETVTCHSRENLRDAISFIGRILGLSSDADAAQFDHASEACLSAAEIVRQIEDRLLALAPNTALDRFLSREFAPAFAAAKAVVVDELSEPRDLPALCRRLVPADFGFHNALRQSDGRLRYIDFDYFGWDDPVKLTADFLLHPAMTLSASDKKLFKAAMVAACANDESFADRLDRRLPLYALRWALILLNPFRCDRRGELPSNIAAQEVLYSRQLGKARAMIAAVPAQ